MTAGSPHAHHADGARLTHAHTERIARRFAEGQSADRIALTEHCTRARVLGVAAEHGWTLDAAGVLPRQQRPAITPGQPLPAVGSGLAAARPVRPLAPLPPIPPAAATGRLRPPRPARTCMRPGCDNGVKTVGLCGKHYMAARRAS